MLERVLIAGSGGQGIVLAGKLLANIAIRSVPHITCLPAYGAEVRGGTSHCQVILSSNEIASPVSDRFDSMLIMNQPSFEAFIDRLEVNGLVVVNTSLCKAPDLKNAVSVNATERADALGDARVANSMMLGAYLARKPLIDTAEVEAVMAAMAGRGNRAIVDLNLKAFRAGMAL